MTDDLPQKILNAGLLLVGEVLVKGNMGVFSTVTVNMVVILFE